MTVKYSHDLMPQLLSELIRTELYLDTLAVAARDLDKGDRATRRKRMTEQLRLGQAVIAAPRVYGVHDGIGSLMMRQYGGAGTPSMPAAHLVAGALARQNGWRLSLPVECARYILGLEERPTAAVEFPYDQPTARHYGKAGLDLMPTDAALFALTAAGQALVLGLPRDVSVPRLVEIGGQAACGAVLADPTFVGWLKDDMASGLLGERERVVSDLVLSSNARAPRRAPKDFVPPADNVVTAKIDGWVEFERDGRRFLSAEAITGHPHIFDGENLSRSSPLFWIDEAAGWARTQSRLYKLGRKGRR